MIRRQLINFQNRSVDVRVGLGAFEELSRMFASAVGKPKRAMVVWNSATSERFGEVVEHALVDAGFAVSPLVLEVSPAGATLADADTVFGALSANGITCDDLVVAVGDTATCSVVCWCANQWCGRTECALLPTTFDAMLTVATTMKPLVASSANALPAIAFRPEPGLVVCDLELVREADPEDLKLGYAWYLLALCFRAASPVGISLLRPSPRFSRARRSRSSMPFNGLRLLARTY